ncbi:hypothetical protein D3C71_1683450 [compost metagenome]
MVAPVQLIRDGMRRTEDILISLPRDLERGVISVRQTLSHDGKELWAGAKTTTSIRTISLDADTTVEAQTTT